MLSEALHRIRIGDFKGAWNLLQPLTLAEPENAEAWRLLGVASQRLGRGDEAAHALERSAALAPSDPEAQVEFALFLHGSGRIGEAETAYRAALAVSPAHERAAHGLAGLLVDARRLVEADRILAAARVEGGAPALRALYAGVMRELNRFDEAEALLRGMIAEHPLDEQAHSRLAEILWMRTGQASEAVREIDGALARHPHAVGLILAKARALQQTGEDDAARAVLDEAIARSPDDPALVGARMGVTGEGRADYLRRVLEARPDDPQLRVLFARSLLEAGDPAAAVESLAMALEHRPFDQLALALQATAWRMLDDPRYGELYDYDRVLTLSELQPPSGWSRMGDYLADLAEGLHAMHSLTAHPFGRSVRGGSQVSLEGARHPAVAAFKTALEPAIGEAIAAMAGHPVAARHTGAFRFSGIWSVRLRSGGFHTSHIHPDGWLSSACYVDTPALAGRQGWLKLGEPGIDLPEPLAAERWVEPVPGRLALFPSYMWHAVEPFRADRPRLTVAFDLVPD